MLRILLLVCLAVSGVGSAGAQSAAARIGTTGLGAEFGLGFSELLAVRGSYGAGSYNYSFTESDIRYRAKIKPSIGLLTLDVHPFAGVFRLSAGLGFNNTNADGTADSTTGTITIGNTVYNTSEVGTVQGRVTFQRTAPYLGLGWGAAPKPGSTGLYFTSDLGIIFSKATGSVTGTCAPTLNPVTCSQLQADLDREAQQFKQEVEKFKYYPVIAVGIGYRF
jgi:hypothetical protein